MTRAKFDSSARSKGILGITPTPIQEPSFNPSAERTYIISRLSANTNSRQSRKSKSRFYFVVLNSSFLFLFLVS